MAASKTVLQLSSSHNSVVPRHGVVTLFGYGIQVRVDRGHLLLDDGVGAERRQFRLPRVGHGLRRLVVIGSDGFVSLAALRWLADQKASFVMLERDGTVLATIRSGPPIRCTAPPHPGPRAFFRSCPAYRAGADPPKAQWAGASRQAQVARRCDG